MADARRAVMEDIKMDEWKEYTGSDEQIAELSSADNGFMLEDGYIVTEASELSILISDIIEIGEKYMICQPHPLADMICQQARTGQQVWIRFAVLISEHQQPTKCETQVVVTNKPDWNIPGAGYSFTPFEEE